MSAGHKTSVTRGVVSALDDAAARFAIDVERAALATLGGGCHLPVGVYCEPAKNGWTVIGVVARPDGSQILREQMELQSKNGSSAEDAGAQPGQPIVGARRSGVSRGGRNCPAGRKFCQMNPLAGRKILITRARHQAQSLASALEEKGATVVAIPAIEIIPPDSYDRVGCGAVECQKISVAGCHQCERRGRIGRATGRLKLPITALDALKIAAIGPATARALGEMGLHVDEVPRQAMAESLVESLRDQVRGKKVLLVRAKVARDVLPEELRNAGATVDVVDAYQTIVPVTSADDVRLLFAAASRMPDVVTFTSSSTVTNFFRLLHEANLPAWPTPVAAASIGPITSQTLRHHGIEPAVEATEYTIPGVVEALCRWSAAHANR